MIDFKIENKPMPPKEKHEGLTRALKELKVGQSFLYAPVPHGTVQATASRLGIRMGRKFSLSQLTGRVGRIA